MLLSRWSRSQIPVSAARNLASEGVEMTIKELNLELPELQNSIPWHIRATPMARVFNAASTVTQQVLVQERADHLAHYRTAKGIAYRLDRILRWLRNDRLDEHGLPADCLQWSLIRIWG